MALYKSQQVYLYNSLTSKKEPLQSLQEGCIGMYVCGPTVYNYVHLGNVRTFVSFDVIFRYLRYLGYKVRYVRNITDAGHLENDADSGEDRIAKKARIDQIEPMEVVQRYTLDFHNILDQLNCLPPSIEPTATGHIIEQIEIIKRIVEKGFAYEVNGSVYFDVIKFNKTHSYGVLSHRKIEELIHNTRELDGQSDKKNPQDFALWKKAEPQHIMRWTSPWSDGFPGWHLECTAMSAKYLGEQFDIHGGGMDLKFPHHECEIAQSKALHGKAPVTYWLHANMLTLNGKKMSKSTGNSILPSELFSGDNDILSKPFSPPVTRFFMLQAHYRSILDFSSDAIIAAEKGYNRLMNAIKALESLPISENSDFDIDAIVDNCYKAMNEDFNTPILIANLFEFVKIIQQVQDGHASISKGDFKKAQHTLKNFTFEVLGLRDDLNNREGQNNKLEEIVNLLINLRKQARENKDFSTSDKIRNELSAIGVQLRDNKDGTTRFTIH